MSGNDHARRDRARDSQYDKPFRCASPSSSSSSPAARAYQVGLGHHRRRGLATEGSRNAHLHAAYLIVEANSPGHSLPLVVGSRSKRVRTILEGAARALVGQREHNRSPRDRSVILIFDLHNRVAIDALLDIVERSFALDDDDLQTGGSLLAPTGNAQKVEYYEKNKKN